ncbi:MAG: hypothetical protein M3Y87_25400, partial [Myxococcota bacterium]|nr:hypothetical protein [Myxococcota bacterium]
RARSATARASSAGSVGARDEQWRMTSTRRTPSSPRPLSRLHRVRGVAGLLVLAVLASYLFLLPGLGLARDLADPALGGPGVPQRAIDLHRDLTPRFSRWARARVASRQAADAPLYDVPTTEWPLFTAVFYLMATEALQRDWEQRGGEGEEPMQRAREAVEAARELVLDPAHHTWVRTHWGDDYMHRENVFFRSLVIAGLTSHEALTRDGRSLPILRDQVETLASALDASELGLLHDYPDECYPIDVLAAIGFIRRADAVLGTDHRAFVARSLRAFEGERADALGLVPYRAILPSGDEVQPARGIGISWILLFAPDLWPERASDWYARYEDAFWQDRGWAAGFREYARGTPGSEWTFEIDAGPVLDGFGTSASAFGIAAARRNGRFDHAYTLSSELVASSWPLPDGTLVTPRVFSHAADAPYLGEAAILYFLTVAPAEGVPIVTGGSASGLVWLGLFVYFGASLLAALVIARGWRRLRRRRSAGVLAPGGRARERARRADGSDRSGRADDWTGSHSEGRTFASSAAASSQPSCRTTSSSVDRPST